MRVLQFELLHLCILQLLVLDPSKASCGSVRRCACCSQSCRPCRQAAAQTQSQLPQSQQMPAATCPLQRRRRPRRRKRLRGLRPRRPRSLRP